MSADMPYESLYVEHEPAARRLALSLVPPHAADDVVAEAFARVLDTSGRNGPPAAFRPYLMAAVRNTARTYHARGRRLVPVPDPEPPPVTGPLRALVEREDARLAGEAYASLPERWRQVLWATAVEEVSVAALASRWDMTANSVSQLASRAREGLRQAYLTANLGSATEPGCRAVAKYMGASVRGKAARRHQAELAAHLEACPRCAQAHAGLATLNHHLGGLIGPAAAAGAGVLARMLPPARAAVRGWHLHPLAAVVAASTVAASGLTAVPFITHAEGPVRITSQAAVASPGQDPAGGIASAAPASAARGRPSADVAGVPAPATSAAPVLPVVPGPVVTAVPAPYPAPPSPDLGTAAGDVPQVAETASPDVPEAGSTDVPPGPRATRRAARIAARATRAAAAAGQPADSADPSATAAADDLAQQVAGAASGSLGGV